MLASSSICFILCVIDITPDLFIRVTCCGWHVCIHKGRHKSSNFRFCFLPQDSKCSRLHKTFLFYLSAVLYSWLRPKKIVHTKTHTVYCQNIITVCWQKAVFVTSWQRDNQRSLILRVWKELLYSVRHKYKLLPIGSIIFIAFLTTEFAAGIICVVFNFVVPSFCHDLTLLLQFSWRFPPQFSQGCTQPSPSKSPLNTMLKYHVFYLQKTAKGKHKNIASPCLLSLWENRMWAYIYDAHCSYVFVHIIMKAVLTTGWNGQQTNVKPLIFSVSPKVQLLLFAFTEQNIVCSCPESNLTHLKIVFLTRGGVIFWKSGHLMTSVAYLNYCYLPI